MRPARRAVRALSLVLLALVALAGCGGGDEDAATTVQDLPDLAALRSDFEGHTGKTRVVLLFAPT